MLNVVDPYSYLIFALLLFKKIYQIFQSNALYGRPSFHSLYLPVIANTIAVYAYPASTHPVGGRVELCGFNLENRENSKTGPFLTIS